MNLPDLYARVVAKRPDLAVPNLAYDSTPHWRDTEPRGWCFHGDYSCPEDPAMVSALILARWVEALPEGHWLAHVQPSNTIPSGWRVWQSTKNGYNISPLRSIPLEALAAFYLGEQP